MKYRKSGFVAAALALVLGVTACSGNETKDDPSKSGQAGRTVVDAAGRTVVIPDRTERIVITCQGGTTNQVAIFGAADKIVAQPDQSQFTQLASIYPAFADVGNAGSFEDTNVEEVLSLKPDIVLAGISSPQANQKLEDAGLTVYTMQIGWATTETIRDEFANLGKILDNEAKAAELIAYWDDKFTQLDGLLAEVADDQRRSVYYTGKTIEDVNAGDWGVSWIKGSGGEVLVDNSFDGTVSVEQAIAWNPDVIITQKSNGTQGLVGDDRIQGITAIKDGAVWAIPSGAFWWDRPSPEAPLGFMWLAKQLYPDEMASIDLKQETKDFYSTFFSYELSDAEYDSFF